MNSGLMKMKAVTAANARSVGAVVIRVPIDNKAETPASYGFV
jgi:hypothetical protein